METPYSGMTEIKEAATLEEANRLLAQGFVLVKVMDRMVYVVGLPKEVSERNAQGNGSNGQADNGVAAHAAVLNSLQWTKFKSGGGEWTFLLGPDDALAPGARALERVHREAEEGEGGHPGRLALPHQQGAVPEPVPHPEDGGEVTVGQARETVDRRAEQASQAGQVRRSGRSHEEGCARERECGALPLQGRQAEGRGAAAPRNTEGTGQTA